MSESEKKLLMYIAEKLHNPDFAEIGQHLGLGKMAVKMAWGKLLDKRLIPMPEVANVPRKRQRGYHCGAFMDKRKKNEGYEG